MDPWIIPASSDDYVVSLHRRLGLELADRRAALGLSAYALGKIAGVTDQTILNLERGLAKNGCWTATLARICLCFRVSVAALAKVVTCVEPHFSRNGEMDVNGARMEGLPVREISLMLPS
jgi:DNA-binding XRE family transcriptional regulator